MMRVFFVAGYALPAQHRKVELLADDPNIELVHLAGMQSGRSSGQHLSANQQRTYTVRLASTRTLGRHADPHRSFGWPPAYGLREFKPQIIHYEGEVESLGAAQIVFLRRIFAPSASLVLTAWQNLMRPRSWVVRRINAWNMHAAQHILCAGEEAVRVLKQQGYRGGTSVCPIMGVDSRYFYPKPVPGLREKLNLNGSVVGYIGRLVPEKGVDTLLMAVAQVPDAIQVLIVGNGPEKDRLQQLGQDLGIGERCRFLEAAPYEAVPDLMNLLDLIVLPSRTTTHWKEQFGRVLVEAMACQVVASGSDSGEIPTVIGDPDRIFPEGDPNALARIIRRITSDTPLRRALGERDQRWAMSRYSVEQLAHQTLSVWRALFTQR